MQYTIINARMQCDKSIKELLDNNIELNYWLGSTIKGAIVNQLKKKYCGFITLKCESCESGITCPIQALFNEKHIQTQGNTSNTIIINTDIEKKNLYTNKFNLEIILLSYGILYKDMILEVLREGIKFKIHGNEIEFYPTNIETEDKLDSNQQDYTEKSATFLKIKTESPLKIQNSASDLSFKQLLRIMMTRIDSVGVLENNEKIYNTDILNQAEQDVKIVYNKTKNITLRRKSSHHNKLFEEKCLVGEIAYTGNLTPYISIIKQAEILNIGKWTTMGLGRISVELI